MRWIAIPALLLAVFLATAFAPVRTDAAESATTAGPPVETRAELRTDFLHLTNEARAEHDRDDLRLARRLSSYATRHSREMADVGFIYHSTDGELRRALDGTPWSAVAENVGVGASLDGLQDAFMGSRPHRRNIVAGSFDHAAIGVVVDYDRVWITVVFYGD